MVSTSRLAAPMNESELLVAIVVMVLGMRAFVVGSQV